MSKTLKISDPINENIKPVRDEDGTITPLELSTDKVRIAGNIDIDGEMKSGSIASPLDISEISTAGEFKITAGGDMTIDVGSDQLVFDVGGYGPVIEIDGTNGTFKMFPTSDLTDYLRIQVGTNGYAKLSTVDTAGTNAYMNLQPDGDLWLKPVTGKTFIVAGDKFYFDTGVDTYITEASDDVLDIYVGAVKMLHLDEASSDIEIKADEVNLADKDGTTYTGDANASVQTKAQIQDMIVQTAEVTISEAEMNALHTTEKELVAAQGSGKVIIPVNVTAFFDRDSSTAQNTNATMWIATDGETGTGNFGYFKRIIRGLSGDRIQTWHHSNSGYVGTSTGDNTSADNKPLTAKCDIAITSGSIDSCKLVIQYYVYDNS